MKTKEKIAVKQFKKSEMVGSMERKVKIVKFGVYVCGRHKGNAKETIAVEGAICSAVGCHAPAKYIGLVEGKVY